MILSALLNVELHTGNVLYFSATTHYESEVCINISEIRNKSVRCRYRVNHLKELDPSFLPSLNVLLNLAVSFHPDTAKRCYILLFVLRLSLRIGQLNDSQTGVPQTPRQCHQLRQREGHHRRLALTCRAMRNIHL